MSLRLRRGTQTQFDMITEYALGEPIWETTNNRLYIGNGTDSILVNPAAPDAVFDDPAAPAGAVPTVLVERSRSEYESEDDGTIDLSRGNNFTITHNPATPSVLPVTFTEAATADGQSGYIIADAAANSSIVFGAGADFTLHTTGATAITVASGTRAFISYTVTAGSNIYASAINPVSPVS